MAAQRNEHSGKPNQEPPAGEFFGRAYLTPLEPQDDSERFRERVAGLCEHFLASEIDQRKTAQMLRLERGILVPIRYDLFDMPEPVFEDFFRNGEFPDLLDGITAIFRVLHERDAESSKTWLQYVRTVMEQENLRYRVDEAGGVRHHVDKEFERSHAALITVLGLPRYRAVAADAERAYDRLSETPAAATEAIKAMFAAVETLTKLIAKPRRVARLNADSVAKVLKPLVENAYRGDESERMAAVALLSGLKAWVEAGHQYRHGQGREAPREAPFEFAVAMLSSGASYLRWLAEIDRRRTK